MDTPPAEEAARDHPVVTCLRCGTLLGPLEMRGKWGAGTSRSAAFKCPCGGEVSILARFPSVN